MNGSQMTWKLIGILYRNFYGHSTAGTMLRLYSSFIQPHLEYATTAWDPFLKKDIELLEGVQWFGLKVCIKSWNCSYEELLDQTRLPTLQSRCVQSKLCHLYSIINGTTYYLEAPIQSREPMYSSRSVHGRSLVTLQARTSQYQNSFSPAKLVPGTPYPRALCLPQQYHSVPGKRPWALKHNSRFWPTWALTRDINSICLYGSCNSDPLKFGTWALTREWALARDTTVLPLSAS